MNMISKLFVGFIGLERERERESERGREGGRKELYKEDKQS
jgi:hypothetical protein